MKYVVLSDAHGNKPFFDECMATIDKMNIDRLIYLGDMFGYMPDGIHILNTLKDRGAFILKGNHEAMLLGDIELDAEKDKIYGLQKQRKLLGESDMIFLSGLKAVREAECGGKKAVFMHGAPFDVLNGYLYEEDQKYSWDGGEYSFIFMGHTHRPYIKYKNRAVFINVGSCGLPRDIGTSPCFCVFDNEKFTVEIKRVQIDSELLKSDYYAEINDKILQVLRRK